jgi:predicted TIM-barrel fold metal-dependent hydrolase
MVQTWSAYGFDNHCLIASANTRATPSVAAVAAVDVDAASCTAQINALAEETTVRGVRLISTPTTSWANLPHLDAAIDAASQHDLVCLLAAWEWQLPDLVSTVCRHPEATMVIDQ